MHSTRTGMDKDQGNSLASRKRRRSSPQSRPSSPLPKGQDDGEDTDFKLAILASLHPEKAQDVLLDYLLAYNGSVEEVSAAINAPETATPARKRSAATGYQSSLASFAIGNDEVSHTSITRKQLTRKGQTLHLYTPQAIENNTPCSIIHNFLPPADAESLLKELLEEAPAFRRDAFQLFDRAVESPHTMGFYVDTPQEIKQQKDQYAYNGSYITRVHQSRPGMLKASELVRQAVNKEIHRRTQDFYGGKKLKFQSTEEWRPNTSFVNCYDGAKESVGYHTDELTYLGPRAVIGSLSLGVAREFRVRKIVPPEETSAADTQGQIAIHLPHNSLLVMHAEMQEEWKHAITPAQTIDPHPIAGNKRLNITYRHYKPYMMPTHTPHCKCKVPCTLRCVQKQKASRGRYMWMCMRNYTPGEKGCAFFEWAEFDEDGRPPWANGYKGNLNMPAGLVET
jgi:alkylated DNA repair dioxygenase AlkB